MKQFFQKSVVTVLGLILFGSSMVWAKPITLTVQHFLSPKSPTQVAFLEPWAKEVEKKSKGQLKIKIFPSMSMGGKPNELYKQVRDGSVDMVWAVAGYTPGVFPRVEVYELPTVHKDSSLATTLAIRENFHLVEKDFKDVKPLIIHVHAGNVIHTIDKPIRRVKDVKGLKLRTPSRTGGWLIDELGADAVGMPMPAFPQALSKKGVDGGLIPFEVFPPFKFHQLTRYSSLGADGKRFGTSVFLFIMNKDSFNRLPKKLQRVIEDTTDLDMVRKVGQIWMDIEEPGIKLQANSKGSQIIKLSKKAMAEFDKVGQRVVDRWIKEASSKGIDGKKLVREARKAINSQ